jgi:hypothetical protein
MSRIGKPYFVLIAKLNGYWDPQFGSFAPNTVHVEARDMADKKGLKRSDWRVICGSGRDALDICHAFNNKTALTA